MSTVKSYQYKNLSATEDAFTYNGELYVALTSDSKYYITSPVNKLTGSNATETSDTAVLSNTLSGQTGKLKFNISFNVHSSMWQDTTQKRIFKLNGIVEFMVDDGTLIVHPHAYPISYWYKIDTSWLIEGWNSVTFRGDGVHIDLDVNTFTTRLFTDDYHEYTIRTYSGFSTSKYLYVPSGVFTPASWNRWRMQYHLITPSSTYVSNDMRVCGTANNTTLSQLVLGAYQKHPVFWLCKDGQASGWSWAHDSGFTITGSQLFNATSHWWYAIEFTGTQYIVSTSNNGSSFAQYAYLDTTEKVTNRDTPYRMGSCENSGYWRGSMILDDTTFIEADGQKVFAGDLSTVGTDYMEQGALTVATEPGASGIAYPLLNIGGLEVYQSPFYLKDLQATKLED